MKKKVETPQEKEAAYKERFLKSLNAANKQTPAPGALQAFKESLADSKREGFTFWREVRSPLEAALFLVLDKDAPPQVMSAIPKVWDEQAQDFLKDLGHAEASPLEKTLIEHAAVCWLRLTLMEIYYTCANATEGSTIKWLEHVERRLMRAQQRFTRACESLMKIRALTLACRLIESRTERRKGATLHQLKAAS